MDWEAQYQAWLIAERDNEWDDRPGRLILRATRKACHKGGDLDNPESWSWVEMALADSQRKWFVADVYNSRAAPKILGERFLRMGVAERDPSRNRWFIEPAVQALGPTQACLILLEYLKSGTDAEKAGAASAFYWVQGDREEPGRREAAGQFFDEMLAAFVNNEDVDVRRSILPMLHMTPESYSEPFRKLVKEAVRIARAHPDNYIRHRIEIQLGGGGSLQPIPRAGTPVPTGAVKSAPTVVIVLGILAFVALALLIASVVESP